MRFDDQGTQTGSADGCDARPLEVHRTHPLERRLVVWPMRWRHIRRCRSLGDDVAEVFP